MNMVVLGLASYVLGAVPFSQIVALHHRGVDLRSVDTGTVSGTALYRVGGFGALIVGGTMDVVKGAVAAALAGDDRAAAVLVCATVILGHCWSVFLDGAGGRGISPAIGALAVFYWPGAALLLAGLAIGRLVRETGFVALIADAVLVVVLGIVEGPFGIALALALVVPMVIKRLLGNSAPDRRSGAHIYRHRLLFDADRHHAI
jgi:glycerol-3-phosphate acyltransferase PlsY